MCSKTFLSVLKKYTINKVQQNNLNVVLYCYQLTSNFLAFVRDAEVQMHTLVMFCANLQYVVKFGILIILHIM